MSLGQLATKLQAVKVGSLKKILPHSPSRIQVARGRLIGRIFFKPPTLTAYKFEAS